jgi:hypothetical protein
MFLIEALHARAQASLSANEISAARSADIDACVRAKDQNPFLSLLQIASFSICLTRTSINVSTQAEGIRAMPIPHGRIVRSGLS